MRNPTHGTQLQLGDEYGYYVTIAQVISVPPPGLTTETIELADHDMTEAKQYLPAALSDIQPPAARIYLDPQDSGHQELYDLAKSKEIVPWRIVLPGGAGTWAFNGHVAGYEPDEAAANDGVLEADITLQPTSVPTLT